MKVIHQKSGSETSSKCSVEVSNADNRLQHILNYGNRCVPIEKYEISEFSGRLTKHACRHTFEQDSKGLSGAEI